MASFANRRRVVVDGNNIGIANATQVGHLLNGTLFGFCKTIGMLMKKYPDSIIQVAWDSKTCWRNDYYPEYKTTRKNDPDPAKKEFFAKYVQQKAKIVTSLLRFPVVQLEAENFEADDIAGHVASNGSPGAPVTLVSNDQDWYSLVRDGVDLFRPKTDLVLNMDNFFSVTKVKDGHDYTKMKAIIGDPGDDIPGIKGIGEGTASAYLNGTLSGGVKYDKIKDWEFAVEGYQRSLMLCNIRNPVYPQKYEFKVNHIPGKYSKEDFSDFIRHYMFKSFDIEKWHSFMSKHQSNLESVYGSKG